MYFALLTLIALIVYYCYSYLTGKPHPKFPPGPYRWPIWGGYLQLLVENYRFPYKAMHWMARRYDTELLGMYLGPYPTVVACSHASVRDMLKHPAFQGRVDSYVAESRDPDWVIRGQFFIDGHRWTEQRRFMLRNLRDFGFGTRNKHFEKMIEEELRDFIDLVQSKHVEGVCHDGKVVVPTVFYSFFLNFILQLLFGTRLPPSLHHKLRELAYAAYRFQLSVDPTTGAINMTPWLRHLASQWFGFDDCKKSNAFMKSFIKERVQEHKDTFLTDALRDFCDVYLKEMENKNMSDAQHWFSEEQMVMTFWDLLFPTSMATTATLGFAIEFLLLYPQVQVRVHQEIDSVVGRSRLPTLDDRKNLPYTEAVLREVMRRETLAALAIPHRCTEDTYFNGYFIPKDTMLLPNLWSSNMDETVWEDPFQFKPERHLEEDGSLKKKDLSIQFGLGKHLCSGETFARQNMFLVFAAMMQNFSLELPRANLYQTWRCMFQASTSHLNSSRLKWFRDNQSATNSGHLHWNVFTFSMSVK
ncbi:probable cytochrome P450 304a1 isoform X1 [Homalodisca vitripennis]|uniref:probable cytochrome P450 304a1 isoform X1 n=2 Tax=Homalodisca vitripennis TaxID=197043 RepID=UPI001EEA5817|nr:probable cytochrome P450 304a1 isoform X1 [Homalodisca vitripennis]